MSVNKVILLGNVGQNPNVKTFQDGGKVANFTLATTKRGFVLKNGTKVPDQTEWHNICATGGIAKVCESYVTKGDRLYLEGELRTRSYEDKNKTKHYITEIVVTSLELLTPKGNAQQSQQAPQAQDAPSF